MFVSVAWCEVYFFGEKKRVLNKSCNVVALGNLYCEYSGLLGNEKLGSLPFDPDAWEV